MVFKKASQYHYNLPAEHGDSAYWKRRYFRQGTGTLPTYSSKKTTIAEAFEPRCRQSLKCPGIAFGDFVKSSPGPRAGTEGSSVDLYL
jgi:hypothetical protein